MSLQLTFLNQIPSWLWGWVLFLAYNGEISARLPDFGGQPPAIVKTLVLDAGHGGHDSGALGKEAIEKDLTLKYTLLLGKKIEAAFPEIRIVYTREDDTFIGLQERAQIANRENADLFISIHCNAMPKVGCSYHGSETYVMGTHRAHDNLAIVERENASIFLENDYKTTYAHLRPGSAEVKVLNSISQSFNLQQAIHFANLIESEFSQTRKFRSNGVKQAGFLVLRATSMPSVLIETGYLTHDKEEQYMMSEEGVEEIVHGIFKAFCSYIGSEQTAQPTFVRDIVQEFNNEVSNSNIDTPNGTESESLLIYKIQLGAFSAKKDMSKAPWNKLDQIEEECSGKIVRYFTGTFKNMLEAKLKCQEIQANGFPDAFIQSMKIQAQKGKSPLPKRT